MNTYGWLLLGQTLLALLGLGLAGGWVLWPFRRAERPFLYSAAPLAGVLSLGGTLAILYFFTGLPFRWCLWVGAALNAAGTVAVLVRGRPARPRRADRAVAVLVVVGAGYWGTVSCNKTAIDAREPTLAAMDGSDMFGYAITADWVRAHPASRPPSKDVAFEVMAHANLHRDGGRPIAFLLVAAAGEVRGTSALFSYDWASGVLLAAAMLGFAGAFAPSALMLVLLAAGAGASSWFANARTGYFGRSVAYPGSVLLAGLFLSAAAEGFTRVRVVVLAALGWAAAFALAPVFVAVVLAMVAGSYCVALGATHLVGRAWRGEGARPGFRAAVLHPALAAVLVCGVTVGPAFAVFYGPRAAVDTPSAPSDWPVVIPVSLDLEPPGRALLKPETERNLLFGCAALLVAGAAVTAWHRHPVGLALVGCAAAVPLSWLLKQNLLHTFQGVLYPLALAGVAVPAAPRAAARWGAARVAVLTALVVATAGLRVPQIRATANHYLFSAQPHRMVVHESDARALRAAIGSEAVDVSVGHYSDNHTALAELVAQRVEVRIRPPAWDRSVRNWANLMACPPPDLLAPKARFALVERNAYAPPGTERYVGRRLKLIEDRDAVTVLGIAGTQEMTWDGEWRPGVWIGNTPTTFLIHNGTGAQQSVQLLGGTSAGPAHPDRDRRTLRYRLGAQTGTLSLPKENTAAILLRLDPGLNRVELSVAEPADPPPKPLQPCPLLEFRDWRLDPR